MNFTLFCFSRCRNGNHGNLIEQLGVFACADFLFCDPSALSNIFQEDSDEEP